MAEKVEIIGDNGDRSVMVNAASEATLQRLLEAVKKMPGADKGGLSSPEKLAEKIQDAHNKSVKKGAFEMGAFSKSLDQGTSSVAGLAKGIAGAVKLFSNSLSAGIDLAFSSNTPKISQFTDAVGDMVPVIGDLIKNLGRVITADLDNFRELAGVGIDLGDSLQQLRYDAAKAGLSLDTYKKTLLENSQALAMFQGSASKGAKTFRDVMSDVSKTFGPKLDNLGFSMEDQSDFTAGYIKRMTTLGRAQDMTQQQLTKGSYDYMLQLDELARVTGMSRKQAQEALDAQTKDLRLKSLLMSVDEKTKKNIEGVTASLKNAELKEMITEMIATGGVPLSDAAIGLATFSPELAKASAALKAGTIDQSKFNEILRRESGRLETMMKTNGKDISLAYQAGVKEYKAAILIAGEYKNFGKELTEEQKRQLKIAEERDATLASLDRAFVNVKNSLVTALGPVLTQVTNLLNGLASKMTPDSPLMQGIQRMSEYVAKFLDELINNGPGKAFKMLWDDAKPLLKTAVVELGSLLGSALKELLLSPAVVGALVGGITLLFASKAAIAAMVKGITEMFSNGPGSGAGGGGAYRGGALGKGKGLGRLGGLAKGGLGALGGLGVGLAADYATSQGHEKTGAALDVGSDALTWGGTGAMLGSVVPGIGTALGGALGAAGGAGYSLYKNWNKFKTPAAAKAEPLSEEQKAALTSEDFKDYNEALAAVIAKNADAVTQVNRLLKTTQWGGRQGPLDEKATTELLESVKILAENTKDNDKEITNLLLAAHSQGLLTSEELKKSLDALAVLQAAQKQASENQTTATKANTEATKASTTVATKAANTEVTKANTTIPAKETERDKAYRQSLEKLKQDELAAKKQMDDAYKARGLTPPTDGKASAIPKDITPLKLTPAGQKRTEEMLKLDADLQKERDAKLAHIEEKRAALRKKAEAEGVKLEEDSMRNLGKKIQEGKLSNKDVTSAVSSKLGTSAVSNATPEAAKVETNALKNSQLKSEFQAIGATLKEVNANAGINQVASNTSMINQSFTGLQQTMKEQLATSGGAAPGLAGTDLVAHLERLNNSMVSLVGIQQDAQSSLKTTARNSNVTDKNIYG